MRIAVTGSSGVVGQAVVKHALDSGHQVVGIDINPGENLAVEGTTHAENAYRFIKTDLKNSNACIAVLRGCDAVIHLAAIRSPGDGLFETHNT